MVRVEGNVTLVIELQLSIAELKMWVTPLGYSICCRALHSRKADVCTCLSVPGRTIDVSDLARSKALLAITSTPS